MTNVELQSKCDQRKWNESRKEGHDKSGEMDYCEVCELRLTDKNSEQNYCKLNHSERVSTRSCAKAYRKLERVKKSKK